MADTVFAGSHEDLCQIADRLLTDEYIALLDCCRTQWALAQLFVLLLETTLNLGAAVEANAPSLHLDVELSLTLVAAGTDPYMASQSLAHVATEVEVL